MMANHVLQKNQGHVCVTVWGHCKGQVPISYREWKGKTDNPHMVPDSVKNLLWDEILKHFTLPKGVEPTQFQKFKQQLDKDYIKKNRTPNWIPYPKLKEH
jgi:hypothetical protein